jgi:hypothetical protein
VTSPFHWYQKFWPCKLDLLIKNFNLGHIFWLVTKVLGLWHFTWVFVVTTLFMGTKIFDLITLTLVLDLLIKNFNHGYNFWIISIRVLTFHYSIPCDKTYPWVPKFLTLWPWSWYLTYLLKIKLIIFKYWYWKQILGGGEFNAVCTPSPLSIRLWRPMYKPLSHGGWCNDIQWS